MRPHGKYAVVNSNDPEAFSVCDRCGFWRNRTDLVWQTAWAGQHIYNVQVLVCTDRCFDDPNEQMRTINLPPDPMPIQNARPPNFAYEEAGPAQSTLAAFAAKGATSLFVDAASVFVVGNTVWIQLNNADYAEMSIIGVDTALNSLTLSYPLPFSAPETGSVTVSGFVPYVPPEPSVGDGEAGVGAVGVASAPISGPELG